LQKGEERRQKRRKNRRRWKNDVMERRDEVIEHVDLSATK